MKNTRNVRIVILSIGIALSLVSILYYGEHLLYEIGREDENATMKTVLICLLMYAQNNDGYLPPPSGYKGLKELYYLKYLGNTDLHLILDLRKRGIREASEVKESDVAFWYVGGHKIGEPSDTIILVQKKKGDWGYVGYLEGRVVRKKGKDWEKLRSAWSPRGQSFLTRFSRKSD